MSLQSDILLISPSKEIREEIQQILSSNGFKVVPIATAMEAHGVIPRKSFDLMIVEGSKEDFKTLLQWAKNHHPNIQALALTEPGEENTAVEYINQGAAGCLFKPLRDSEVRFEVHKAIAAAGKPEAAAESKTSFVHQDSRNPQMADLYHAAVKKIAQSDSTVLIQGESGTGKELMAHWIYAHSMRKDKPLVKVSCAVLPQGVLESELFGHEKGSFTGAYTKRKGRFELADKGTIFLDEIGDIPPAVQSKFLRVLQEKEFQRIGSNQTVKVDVRVIAATSRDLLKEVEEGRFREDFYYRLNVISLKIPPLRERREDIPPLAEMFTRKFSAKSNRNIVGIDESALRLLIAYGWPGNVRELENVIERAVVLASGNKITTVDLPNNIIHLMSVEPRDELTLKQARENFEKNFIHDSLVRFRGNVSQAAKHLGLARKNLIEKIKKYNIDPGKYR